jgi:hypothetical protein
MALGIFVLLLSMSALLRADEQPQQVDTRVWSQSYWLKMARLGLVEVAPSTAVKDAVYTSSRIEAPGIATNDSPDVPVTNDPNVTQSENSIFVNPSNINSVLNSNNSTSWPVSTLYGADALFSNDGGLTWGGSIQGAGGENSGDPATAIGLNGWYYVGYIHSTGGQGVSYSIDGGQNWTAVLAAPAGSAFLDKNHLWIDNSPTSPYEGYLYSAWTNFYGANDGDIEIIRSTDGGLTWSTPVNISSAVNAGSHNQGVHIQTGPNGEVYVAWAIYDSWPSDETAIGFTRSFDGGATFEPATRIITNIRGIRSSRTSKDMRVASFPVMAVDISGGPNNGAIYLVWTNIGVPGINSGPDIDIYMIKSIDNGTTWSTPVRVNQDPSGLGKEHYLPWITCDPVMGGLSVIFYDDRNVSSTDCEVFVAVSLDGGNIWSDFKVSDVSFTPSPIPGLANSYFGDYLGISARGGKVYPCWTDNRDGRAMAYVSPFALEEDSTPPNPVIDLAVTDVGSNWITLTWTASGDDADSGKASSYDIRYSTSPIDENNFDAATKVPNPPIPQIAGSPEVFTVTGLDFNTTYYFALRVLDEWANQSPVSNSPSGTTFGVPDIDVSPDTLRDSLLTGESSVHTLTIRNLGEDPSTLDFFLPDYGGQASLQVTGIQGDQLSLKVILLDETVVTERPRVRQRGYGHLPPQGQSSSFPLLTRTLSNLTPDVTIFYDDMENSVNGWTTELYGGTTDDLWHLTNTSYNSPSTSWWCGIEGQGNYETGNQINTAVISPPIDLSFVTAPITLQFFESYYTESGWDFCMVDVSIDGGTTWIPLRGANGSAPSGNSDGWIMTVLDLSSYEGQVIKIRFYFDTGDGVANDYPGWFFDDVLVTASGYSFLSVNPAQGSIPAGDSMTLSVTFDATGMPGGNYELNVDIYNNDPDESIVSIPAYLHVTGAPDIAVSADTLDFGNVFIGAFAGETLFVSNNGTDSLFVSDISTDDAHFTVDITSFAINYGESQPVVVTFTPTATGPMTAMLTIVSNDSDEPVVTVTLQGEGLLPPDIAVSPDSLFDTLFVGATSSQLLTISNTGFSNLTFGITTTDTVGSGMAARFDGVDDYIEASPVNVDYLTVEAWTYWENFVPNGASPAVVSNGNGYDEQGYMLYQAPSLPYNRLAGFVSTSNGTSTIWGTRQLDLARWHHVAMTYDGTALRLYLDGALDTMITATGTINPSTTYPLLFGMPYEPGNTSFDGMIDEIRIWNYARTQSEIQQMMNFKLGGTEAGLVGYWNFDGANPWEDRTPNGNDGTPYNGVTLVNSTAPLSTWLSVSPTSGIVPADSSSTVTVTFDARFVYGGDYQSDIIISSDDPDEPEVVIPARLHVIGAPNIMVWPDSIDYGTVFLGASVPETVVVTNNGTDLLTVSDVSLDNPNFTIDMTSFTVAPATSQNLVVTFSPVTTGVSNGTLTITSDDPDKPTTTVALTGEGLLPPDIAVSPDFLFDTLFVGETSSQVLSISNTGANNLTFNVAIQESSGTGLLGGGMAASFDGFDDYVMGDPVNVPYLTLCAWVNWAQFYEDNTGHAVLSNGDAGGNGYMLYQGTGGIYNALVGFVYTDQGGLQILKSLEPLNTDQWYHIAMTYDGSTLKFYINGVLDTLLTTSGTIVPSDQTHPLLMASTYVPTGSKFNGMIDELQIWDHALTQSEIQNIMNISLTGYEPGLEAYWNFDDTTDPWGDLTPNQHDGTPYGGVTVVPSTAPIAAWIAAEPTSGVVFSGASVDVTITFNTSGLIGGDYYADINILSDDPDEPEVTIPAQLHVVGAPDIYATPDSLDLGVAFIGYSTVDTILVINLGTDSLTVTGISTDNPVFTTDVTNFVLAVGESRPVVVTFSPTSTGSALATLSIESDDPDEPITTIPLSGLGADAPVISLTPDSFDVVMYNNDSMVMTLTIDNLGGYDLDWTAYVQVAQQSPKKLFTLPAPDPNTGKIVEEETPETTPQPGFLLRSTPLQAMLSDLTGVNILYDRAHGQASQTIWSTIIADVESRGATVTINSSPLTPELLNGYHILWLTDMSSALTGAEITAIQGWLFTGAGLLLEGDNTLTVPIYNSLLTALNVGIEYSDVDGTPGTTSNIFDHETTVGVGNIYLNANLAHLSSLSAPAGPLVNDVNNVTNTAYSVVGAGRIVAMADELFENARMGTADNRLFANQVFDWLAVIGWLDVAPSSGTLPPGSSTGILVLFNSFAMSSGDYNAEIVISSNDPSNPVATVPAHLQILICGDVDGNGIGANIADLTYLVDYLFRNGPPPPNMATANVDGIGDVNVGDLTYLVDYLFRQGPDLICGPIQPDTMRRGVSASGQK